MERNLSERYQSNPAIKQLPQKSKSFAHPQQDHHVESRDCLKPLEESIDQEDTSGVDNSQEESNENAEPVNESPPPPEVDYTLQSISDDIDMFISSLVSKDHEKETEKEVEEQKEVQEVKDNEGENENEKEEHHENVVIPAFVNKFLDLLEEEIVIREGDEGKGKWGQDTDNDGCFVQAVNRISKLNFALVESGHDDENGPLINRAGGIQQRAMFYLEEEFKKLLEDCKDNQLESDHQRSNSNEGKAKQTQETDDSGLQESENVEEESCFLGYSDDSVSNMKVIADVMINGGFKFECSQLFIIIRRHAFNACLHKIGFEKISIDEMQKMQWETLEKEIPSWNKTYKDCATIYFSKERQLTNSVFAGYPEIANSIFSDLIWVTMTQLLNFTQGVAMTKKGEVKLFKFLDMYETIRDNFTILEGLFPEECASDLRTEMTSARCRIGETAIYLFCDLENSIKADTGKNPVPGGAVHPLTRYTMNYLTYASEYKATLEQVCKEHSKIERVDSTSRPHFEGETQEHNSDTRNDENQSPFSKQLMKIMDLLDSNLEGKSKLYKDIPLSCIFMMNNGRYILQKIKRSSEIHEMMGDTWSRRKSSELRNYHKNYQRETWNKLLSCLNQEGLQVNGKVVKPVLKERFKSFSTMFDEIHKTQSSWVVNDEQLQSELRVSISAVVIPAYRSFLGRFSQYLTPGRQYEKYIKFQPEDIETYIDELFDGNPSSAANKRRP